MARVTPSSLGARLFELGAANAAPLRGPGESDPIVSRAGSICDTRSSQSARTLTPLEDAEGHGTVQKARRRYPRGHRSMLDRFMRREHAVGALGTGGGDQRCGYLTDAIAITATASQRLREVMDRRYDFDLLLP